MTEDKTLRQALIKTFLWAALALLGVPLLTYGFVRYAQHSMDGEMLQAVTQRMDENDITAPEKRAQILEEYSALLPSVLCSNTDPEAQEFRDDLCEFNGRIWHFHWARAVSLWTLALGVATLAGVLVLGRRAFASRQAQYSSLLLGWRFLQFSSAAVVVLQGVLCLWLSFWLTAFFWHSYYVKLIMIAALFAGMGILVILRKIFQRIKNENVVEGEVLAPQDAPALVERVRQIAAQLQTEPPQHIIGGIDTNFFVTESPITAGTQALTGRALFVSIPLLRQLTPDQASAVLSHELAHFSGGDTQAGAKFGPLLLRYDTYLEGMSEGGLTRLVYPAMQLFRLLLQMAMSRDSRQREFLADSKAAKVISAQAISESLIKIGAYAQYRNRLENKLFESQQKLGNALGLSDSVAQGLPHYAISPDFAQDMREAHIPHPFDSHPPLAERMKNAGHVVAEGDMAAIVQTQPTVTWADAIHSASAIEQRLWGQYEEQFAQNHEETLAWRYEPATDEEREHVEKYFPPVQFEVKKGFLLVDYRGLTPADGDAQVLWDDVHALTYTNSSLGDTLAVTLKEKRAGGMFHRTQTVKLRGLGKQKDAFTEAVGRYWARNQTMHKWREESAHTEE